MSALEVVNTEATYANGRRIFEPSDAVCMKLVLKRPGDTKKVKSSEVDIDADKDVVRVSKTIIDCDEFRAIKQFDQETRRFFKSRTLEMEFVGNGAGLVPPKFVEELDAYMEVRKAERATLVEQFMEVYPNTPSEMALRLRELYREGDYLRPERVRAAFNMEINYLAFSVPGRLAQISKKIFEREHDKARAQVEASLEKIEDQLFAMANSFTEYLLDRLTPDQTSLRAKKITASYIDKIKDFFINLKERNITGNSRLDEIADAGALILGDIDAATLRGKDKEQGPEDIKAMMQLRLKPLLDDAICEKPTRRLRVVEDEE